MTDDSSELLHRLVYDFARRRTFDWLSTAARRGIISAHQGEALMAVWDETHPYEPLDGSSEAALP